MFNTASVIARGKAALQGSETEQRIAVILYDDCVDVISTFELNQLASLTFHENQVITGSPDLSSVILDHLENIMKDSGSYSLLTVEKTLIISKHLLLHGSEKILPLIHRQLSRHIAVLQNYNTVLQQQNNLWMSIKGGGVDKGGPVRELATLITSWFANPPQFSQVRAKHADPTSLVPIGDRREVGFCPDDIRYKNLQRALKLQAPKSNLAKADNGFGSGYMAKDGKHVVGAAHGIEEMLKMEKLAKMQKQQNTIQSKQFADYTPPGAAEQSGYLDSGYTDSGPSARTNGYSDAAHNSDYLNGGVGGNGGSRTFAAPASGMFAYREHDATVSRPAPPPEVDLLDLGAGETVSSEPSATTTIADPFQATTTQETLSFQPNSSLQPAITSELLGRGSIGAASSPFQAPQNDPFQISVASVAQSSQATRDPFQMATGSSVSVTHPSSTMPDPFGPQPSGTFAPSGTSAQRAVPSVTIGSVPITSIPMTAQQPATMIPTTEPISMGTSTSEDDRFAALDALANTKTNALDPRSMPQASKLAAPNVLSSIQVSKFSQSTEDDGGGFVMGGSAGSGLQPLGPAPGAPPPPPPS